MPADLFAPATSPSPAAPRRASIVPLTVAVHAAVLVAVLMAPLVAEVRFPEPQAARLAYTEVSLPKAPRVPAAAPAARPAAAPASAPDPRIAPLEAPTRIRPEQGVVEPAGAAPFGGQDDMSALLGDMGDPDGISLPPARPARPTAPVHVGGVVQPPRKIRDVRPVYPTIALQSRVQGMVILEAVIGADGRVQDVRVLQHKMLLDEAAVAAVRQWVFEPTRLNGEAVPVVMTVTVEFRLE